MLDAATVTLSESEIKRCEKLVAEFIERRRPPPRLRKDVDLAFRMKGQSIEIFELRAHWSGSGKPVEHPIAKAAYNKSSRSWKIFWQRADLKWHRYEPLPEVGRCRRHHGGTCQSHEFAPLHASLQSQ